MSEENPFDRVVGSWEAVIEDMDATATEYRENGFSVLCLHPGDVTVVGDEGLDVLVPDDEYDGLEAFASEARFDSYEVYRAVESGMAFVLVVLTDPETDRAVCCPAYYDESDIEALRNHAEEDTLSIHVRPLADDRGVTFTLSDFDFF